LRVLVTAEIIAIPYYRALGAATQSPLLQAICATILQDEAAHLRFQASMLWRLSASRPLIADRIVSATHRLFLFITCQVVWSEHRLVFRAAGYARGGFLAESLWEFDRLDAAVGCGPLRACIPMANEEDEESASGSLGSERAMAKTQD
jgi:hypothetical protein